MNKYLEAENMRALKGRGMSEVDALVSLKRTKKEKKGNEVACSPLSEEYPYGVSLQLDDETMKKLAMGMPDVGDEVKIIATGKITSVSSNASEGHQSRTCTVQLTKMKVS